MQKDGRLAIDLYISLFELSIHMQAIEENELCFICLV